MALSLLILVLGAVYWNLFEKTFVYLEEKGEFSALPKPTNSDTSEWFYFDGGLPWDHSWYQVNKGCNEVEKKKYELNAHLTEKLNIPTHQEKFAGSELSQTYYPSEPPLDKNIAILKDSKFLWSQKCYVSEQEGDEYKRTGQVWKSSFGDFILFQSPIFAIFLIGFLLRLGCIERVYKYIRMFCVWIKTGNWD